MMKVRLQDLVSKIAKKNFLINKKNFCTGFQILFLKGWHEEQLSLCVPLHLGKRPASEWLSGLEYAISHSLASALNETYFSLPALLKGLEVLTEQQGIYIINHTPTHPYVIFGV